MKDEREKKDGNLFSKIVKTFFKVVGSYTGILSNILGTALGILAAVLIALFTAGVCVYVKVLPDFTKARETAFDKLVNMNASDFVMNENTVIFDSKGKKVGTVNAGHYKYISIKNISPYIYNGYIAVEDKRFKTHAGVDVLATLRAGVALLRHNGEITQGGSTITQQVIKNNLLSQERSFTRKMAEILLAPTVEQKFSKDQIMEFYCNSNYYGNRCYGVGAACKYYFDKKPSELTPEEAALLISLSNNPTKYDPVNSPKDSLEKRNSVLKTMEDNAVISKKEYRKAVKTQINVVQLTGKVSSENYVVSYAIHCAALTLMDQDNFEFKYTFDDKEDYEDYQDAYSKAYSEKSDDIRSGGYKIYTTIDSEKQKKLQAAVDSGLAFNTERDSKTNKYALQGDAVCVDNRTNYVVAIVGGRGTDDSYNRAYLSLRQSGSSIKPLIDYAPGFESGMYSPSTMVDDHAIKNGPQNSGGGYAGRLHLRDAVARSINTIAWQVLENITPEYGLSFLDKLHFHGLSYVDNGNLALSLGGFTNGVRAVDMAKGFSTLANNGAYSERTCIKKIEHSSDGTVYQDNEETPETTQVYSQDAAWMMTDVLKGVLNEPFGTGRSLALANGQIAAGKTGTANSSKDLWFCGYTSYYTTVVWTGFDTPRAMPGMYGATVPGKIWKTYMDEIHKNLEPEDFVKPDTVVLAKYDSNGNIIKGTESTTMTKRSYGYDYFSTTILETTTDYVTELKDKAYQKTVLKDLKKFENMYIDELADYYTLEETYDSLKKKISSIEDDDVRKSYMTRATDKYESMADQTQDWKKVVKAYNKRKAEEDEALAQETNEKSVIAATEGIKDQRIAYAKAAISRIKGKKYKPDNLSELIKAAESAVDKCKNYSEYSQLSSDLSVAKNEVNALPTKEEYQAQNNVTPVATSTPESSRKNNEASATQAPAEASESPE